MPNNSTVDNNMNTQGNGNTNIDSTGQSTTPTNTTSCLSVPADVKGICEDCLANENNENEDK